MIKGTIKFKGGRALQKKLKVLDSKLKGVSTDIGNAALLAGAQPIIDNAKSRAPIDSTIDDNVHIRDNIGARVVKNPRNHFPFDNAVIIRPFGPAVYYWRFNEFGGLKTRAVRFMTLAFDSQKRNTLKEIRNSLIKNIDQEIKKL